MLNVNSPATTQTSPGSASSIVHKGRRQEEGQGLVEYALILGFLAVLVLAALNHLQPAINSVFNTTAATLTTSVRVEIVGSGTSCYPASTAISLVAGGTVEWDLAGGCTGAGALQITDPQGNSLTTPDINSMHPTYSYVVATSGTYTFSVRGVVGTITVR